MSDENMLTKEIAEQFLADDNSVYLGEFTATNRVRVSGVKSSLPHWEHFPLFMCFLRKETTGTQK